MIYNGKAIQCKSEPDSAYSISESHNNMDKEVKPKENVTGEMTLHHFLKKYMKLML